MTNSEYIILEGLPVLRTLYHCSVFTGRAITTLSVLPLNEYIYSKDEFCFYRAMEFNRKHHHHMKDDNFSPFLFLKKDQSCNFQQGLDAFLKYCIIKSSSF